MTHWHLWLRFGDRVVVDPVGYRSQRAAHQGGQRFARRLEVTEWFTRRCRVACPKPTAKAYEPRRHALAAALSARAVAGAGNPAEWDALVADIRRTKQADGDGYSRPGAGRLADRSRDARAERQES